jgi:hypothetical protein
MNLIIVILIIIALWLVSGLLQAYRNIEQELREIRIKLGMPTDNPDQVDPVKGMKDTVVGGLKRVKDAI